MKVWRLLLLCTGVLLTACSGLTSDAVLQGRITVEVTTRQGLPLSDVRLLLFRGDRQMEYVRTDAVGRAVFRDVPRGTYGIFAVLEEPVRGFGSFGGGDPEGNVRVPIEIVGGEVVPITFTLVKAGRGIFEALVLDNDGLPIANIEIVAYTPFEEIGVQRTGLDGIARFDSVPFGAFGAYAIVPESVGGPGAAPIIRQGMFFDAGHLERRTYTIARCRGTITTRVLDQSNVPVPNYPVSLFTATEYLRSVPTSTTGNALFSQVGCGDYFVTADSTAGFSVTNTRGQGFQDGLRINSGSTLTPTLRVNRLP